MTRKPVLVIDGDGEMRERLRTVLEMEGLAVEIAADSAAALERLVAGFRPCAIVMNLMMPDMNGVEFRRRQMETPELAGIPVITYSGLIEAGARHAAGGGGRQQDIDGILTLVRQHCGRSAPPTQH
jgi:CheY-like chemotaxis protein